MLHRVTRAGAMPPTRQDMATEAPRLGEARAVLFDLDGTLVITHIDFGLMKRRMLSLVADAGVPADRVRDLDILTLLEEAARYLGGARGPALREAGWGELERLELEMCSAPELVPDAAPLLSELRRVGVAVGIVTRNCRRVAENLLEQAGLEHDALVAREDAPGRTKPHPEHVREALRLLGGPSPALMVGDHWMDIRAGLSAGLATIGILNGRSPDVFAPAVPHYAVEDMTELRALLNNALQGLAARHAQR